MMLCCRMRRDARREVSGFGYIEPLAYLQQTCGVGRLEAYKDAGIPALAASRMSSSSSAKLTVVCANHCLPSLASAKSGTALWPLYLRRRRADEVVVYHKDALLEIERNRSRCRLWAAAGTARR